MRVNIDNRRAGIFRRLFNFFSEIIVLLLIVFSVRTFIFGLYQVPSGSMETTMLVGERFFADKLSYWFRAPRKGEVISFNAPSYTYSTNALVKLYERYVGYPQGPDNWTKRIIGVPGDHVQGKIEDGRPTVYLNGAKLEEPYVNALPLLYESIVDPQVLLQKQRLGIMAVGRYKVPKSYDPARPIDDQLFYRINPERVVRNAQGEIELDQPKTPVKVGGEKVYRDNDDYLHGDDFDVHLKDNEYWVMGDNRLGSSDSRFFGPIQKNSIHGRIVFRIWSVDSNEAWWIVDLIKHPIDFVMRIRWNRFFNWIG